MSGPALIDVLLDHAGVPDGVDAAWRPKQFLGTPVPGASFATLNLAHVVIAIAIEFVVAEFAETANDAELPASGEAPIVLPIVADAVSANDTERVA